MNVRRSMVPAISSFKCTLPRCVSATERPLKMPNVQDFRRLAVELIGVAVFIGICAAIFAAFVKVST